MPPHAGDAAPSSIETLLRQVSSFASLDPRGASSGLQREGVEVLVEVLGRTEALLVSWVGAFDAAGVHAADGARSAGAWLAARTELDPGSASALVHRARDLRHCLHVASSHATGGIGPAKVRALLAARRAHPELFAEHEAELVAHVAPLTVAHARVVAAHWKHLAEATKAYEDAEAERACAAAAGSTGAGGEHGGAGADGEGQADGGADVVGDAAVGLGSEAADGGGDHDGESGGAEESDGAEEGAAGQGAEGAPDPFGSEGCGPGHGPAPEDPAATNSLRLVPTFQGRWVLEGDLDPVSGAELDEAIQAFIDRQFHDGTWSADDGLTVGFRRAHALVELIGRGANAATRHGDPRPSVAVRIDPATLAGLPASTLAEGLERECCLDDGTPVDARSVERLLCTARVQALWTRVREDGAVETLGVTDLLRDATRAQRRALKQRDGRCVFPGCGAAADWCEAHHLVPHEDLGPTLLHNLVLLCRFHHHLVHEGGWTLWRDAGDGELHLLDPLQRPRPIGQPGTKQPVLHHDQLTPVRPPPMPPHLRPPRFRTSDDPPRDPPDAPPEEPPP
jgi:hypothetical protein